VKARGYGLVHGVGEVSLESLWDGTKGHGQSEAQKVMSFLKKWATKKWAPEKSPLSQLWGRLGLLARHGVSLGDRPCLHKASGRQSRGGLLVGSSALVDGQDTGMAGKGYQSSSAGRQKRI
jgi:hypothetical protein